jgi:hypothetical protein
MHDVPTDFVIDGAVALVENYQTNVRWQLPILNRLDHTDLHGQAVIDWVICPNDAGLNPVKFSQALLGLTD